MINLTPTQLETVKSTLKKFVPHCEVWVFGSRIGNKIKKFSDLDLVVKDKSPLPGQTLFEINHAFDESDLPFQVDIVDWNLISEEFKTIILNNHLPLKFL